MEKPEYEKIYYADLSDEQRAFVDAKLAEIKAVVGEYKDEAKHRAETAVALEQIIIKLEALYLATGFLFDNSDNTAKSRMAGNPP